MDIGIKSHEESKTSVVDVFELSKNLRRDRHGIVCTLEHYNFIYQVRVLRLLSVSLIFRGFWRHFFTFLCPTPVNSVLACDDRQVLGIFYQNTY